MLAIGPGPLRGRVLAPPSKSATHRALILAALGDEPGSIGSPLRSADTLATLAAIRAFGATVLVEPAEWIVHPRFDLDADLAIDCGNSGTTLRLVTALAGTRRGATRLDGDPSLRRRPMAPLLAALEAVGVAVESRGGSAPLSVRGPLRSRDLVVDGGQSSQFASGLLLALTASGGGTLTVVGKVVSTPYLEMTLRALAQAGVAVARDTVAPGATRFHVPLGARPRAGRVAIPGDWSSAAFFLCAGALGGDVVVEGLREAGSQADGVIVALLQAMGARLDVPSSGDRVSVRESELHGIDADLGSSPDLFPVLAVTLAQARGPSRLYGAPQLRGKESDRIALVARNLRRQGAEVEEAIDGLVLAGGARLSGGPVETGGDHRILMAFAVGAIRAGAPMTFADADPAAVVAVSYPGFLDQLAALRANAQP